MSRKDYFDEIKVGNRFITRDKAPDQLNEWFGPLVSYTKNTLAKLAYEGGGPPMVKCGHRIAYPEKELFDWAKRRIKRVNSTSDPGRAVSDDDDGDEI